MGHPFIAISKAARPRGLVRRLPSFFFGLNPGLSFGRVAFGTLLTASTVRATSSQLENGGLAFALLAGIALPPNTR